MLVTACGQAVKLTFFASWKSLKKILGPNLHISQSGAFAKQISVRRSKK